MNSNQEFLSYKKVLLFGDKATGKSTLIYRLGRGRLPNLISPTEESKKIIYIITNKIYYNYSIKTSSIKT